MTYTEQWLALREDLTNPAELSAARREAIQAVQRWVQKWHDQLPERAVAELGDAVGQVVTGHGGHVPANAVEVCRTEGRDGTVAELAACVRERDDEAPPRRGLAEGSAWIDFLCRSGDLRQFDGEAISEEEKAAQASYGVCMAPDEPTSVAAELLAGL